jgi:hypothetical protein
MDLNRIFKILQRPPFQYCFSEYPHNSGSFPAPRNLRPTEAKAMCSVLTAHGVGTLEAGAHQPPSTPNVNRSPSVISAWAMWFHHSPAWFPHHRSTHTICWLITVAQLHHPPTVHNSNSNLHKGMQDFVTLPPSDKKKPVSQLIFASRGRHG